jgi:predicted MFS family arabinose efflux permease
MQLNEEVLPKNGNESFMQKILEGFRYSAANKLILHSFILLSTASFMGMSVHMVLFPVIADRQIGGGAETLGYLTAAMGLGAIFGALALASRRSVKGLERLPAVAFGVYGVMTGLLALTSSLHTALFISAIMGVCIVFGWSASNTLLQVITAKEKLSRVMSIYMMSFSGMSPIGSLFMGWFSTRCGTPVAMIFGGGSCLVAALYFLQRTRNLETVPVDG